MASTKDIGVASLGGLLVAPEAIRLGGEGQYLRRRCERSSSRTRACTHVVRRIDSGRLRGIPESGNCVISIAALQLSQRCRDAVTYRLVTGSVRGSSPR